MYRLIVHNDLAAPKNSPNIFADIDRNGPHVKFRSHPLDSLCACSVKEPLWRRYFRPTGAGGRETYQHQFIQLHEKTMCISDRYLAKLQTRSFHGML